MDSFNQINNLRSFKKINVVGTSGSGKSTLSKKIADKLGAKYIGLDELHWLPNWQGRTDEDLFELLRKQIQCEAWVVDGNYNRTTPIKWKDVEVIVLVDLPFWLTLYQAITRAIKRAISGEELWPGTGNVETFSRSFLSRDSIILWTIKTYKKVKRRYEEVMVDPQYRHIKIIRLCSREECQKFLDGLS